MKCGGQNIFEADTLECFWYHRCCFRFLKFIYTEETYASFVGVEIQVNNKFCKEILNLEKEQKNTRINHKERLLRFRSRQTVKSHIFEVTKQTDVQSLEFFMKVHNSWTSFAKRFALADENQIYLGEN